MLASCSSNDDDNSENGANVILPKTVNYTYNSEFGSENSKSVIVYDGNKIVSVTSAEYKTEFTYDGNFIVKEVEYAISGGKNIKEYETVYLYADGKLKSSTYVENYTAEYPNGQYKMRLVYTHNPDGTVTHDQYRTDVATGVETKSNHSEVLTFQNGNLVKRVETEIGLNSTSTEIYEYDDKNNPFKNILGFNLLLDKQDGTGTNNLIKTTHSISSEFFEGITYEYNTDGYPIKATTYRSDGTTDYEITEYTY